MHIQTWGPFTFCFWVDHQERIKDFHRGKQTPQRAWFSNVCFCLTVTGCFTSLNESSSKLLPGNHRATWEEERHSEQKSRELWKPDKLLKHTRRDYEKQTAQDREIPLDKGEVETLQNQLVFLFFLSRIREIGHKRNAWCPAGLDL